LSSKNIIKYTTIFNELYYHKSKDTKYVRHIRPIQEHTQTNTDKYQDCDIQTYTPVIAHRLTDTERCTVQIKTTYQQYKDTYFITKYISCNKSQSCDRYRP